VRSDFDSVEGMNFFNSRIFPTVLSIVVKNWKQPKCPSTEWINKLYI
jgi:hypothetical protein